MQFPCFSAPTNTPAMRSDVTAPSCADPEPLPRAGLGSPPRTPTHPSVCRPAPLWRPAGTCISTGLGAAPSPMTVKSRAGATASWKTAVAPSLPASSTTERKRIRPRAVGHAHGYPTACFVAILRRSLPIPTLPDKLAGVNPITPATTAQPVRQLANGCARKRHAMMPTPGVCSSLLHRTTRCFA